jgi:hypothetical protein
MSKKHSMNGLDGPNGVEHSHVRHKVYPNGNQGFSQHIGNLGGDTVPGPAKGAPLSSKKEQLIQKRHVEPNGMNPFNKHEGNESGVLASDTIKQHAPGRDSPVPEHAERPDISIKDKADAVVHYSEGPLNDFPSDGVMHSER